MAFETRDQVLERVVKMEKPKCPHCGAEAARGDQCESCGKWFEQKMLLADQLAALRDKFSR